MGVRGLTWAKGSGTGGRGQGGLGTQGSLELSSGTCVGKTIGLEGQGAAVVHELQGLGKTSWR